MGNRIAGVLVKSLTLKVLGCGRPSGTCGWLSIVAQRLLWAKEMKLSSGHMIGVSMRCQGTCSLVFSQYAPNPDSGGALELDWWIPWY